MRGHRVAASLILDVNPLSVDNAGRRESRMGERRQGGHRQVQHREQAENGAVGGGTHTHAEGKPTSAAGDTVGSSWFNP